MAEIKLTKSELRIQQNRLQQLQKYLPTLQLKKAMLQSEVSEARNEISKLEIHQQELKNSVESYSALLSDKQAFDPEHSAKIATINKRYENIAGVEVPFFESIAFKDYTYNLFESPPWVDAVVFGLRGVAENHAHIEVVKEKRTALEKELREVSIRVNLFEKILIPRSLKNIKKIKVFLGDQQLAAVSQAKVAKTKIEERDAQKKDIKAGDSHAL
jgi:V/A-type H+-transporting ATPase subunit D